MVRLERPSDVRWRMHIAAALFLLLWVCYLYADTAISMVAIWARSETFTHGFLVGPVALWLIWRERETLLKQVPSPNASALLLVGVFGLIWLTGHLAGTNSIVQFAFVGMLVASAITVLGWSIAKTIAFPLGFLFFAVPAGEFLLPVFMRWTADFTVFALRFSGIPVYREGLQFVIPSGNWSVVEACSGIRYLIASLTIGTLFAYLSFSSWQRRWLFVGVSIAVPIVANWLRAYLIVMLGHLSGNRLATGVDHLVYGWVFFGFIIVIMLALGGRWADVPVQKSPEINFKNVESGGPSILIVVVILTVILIWVPKFASNSKIAGIDRVSSVELNIPDRFADGWEKAETHFSDWRPIYESATKEINLVYQKNASFIGLHIAYYRNQNYDQKLISSVNRLTLAGGANWSQVANSEKKVVCGDRSILVKTAELQDLRGSSMRSTSNTLIIWKFYWVDGSITVSDSLALAYRALARLHGRGDDSAAILIYSFGQGAEQGLAEFLQVNCKKIGRQLAQARESL